MKIIVKFKKTMVILCLFIICFMFLMCDVGGLTSDPPSMEELGKVTHRGPGAFVKGADVSYMLNLEDKGADWKHNGQSQPLLTILGDHGFNAIRLMAWVNPGDPNHNPSNQTVPHGYHDTAHCVEAAERAKNQGFDVLIDIFYCDGW